MLPMACEDVISARDLAPMTCKDKNGYGTKWWLSTLGRRMHIVHTERSGPSIP